MIPVLRFSPWICDFEALWGPRLMRTWIFGLDYRSQGNPIDLVYPTHPGHQRSSLNLLIYLPQRIELPQNNIDEILLNILLSLLLIMLKTNFQKHRKVGSEDGFWCLPFCDSSSSWQSWSHTLSIKSAATKTPDLLHIFMTWTWKML